jgi:hypothetical protein
LKEKLLVAHSLNSNLLTVGLESCGPSPWLVREDYRMRLNFRKFLRMMTHPRAQHEAAIEELNVRYEAARHEVHRSAQTLRRTEEAARLSRKYVGENNYTSIIAKSLGLNPPGPGETHS